MQNCSVFCSSISMTVGIWGCNNLYLYFSLCTVHGFANAVYDVEEGEILDTTFELNVKGTTSLALVIWGNITSERGTASG